MSKSMTGFARHSFSWQDFRFELEVRSINHRYLEVNIQLPKSSMQLDLKIRKMLEVWFKRGKISLNVRLDNAVFDVHYEIDHKRLGDYITNLVDIKESYKLSDCAPSAYEILKLPGVLVENSDTQWPEELEIELEKNLSILFKNLSEARSREGLSLAREIEEYLNQIQKICEAISSLRSGYAEQCRLKFEEKLQAFDSGKIDEQRLHMELAILIEKSDVEEEIVRLKSHLELGHELLSKDGPSGKDWNFLCQEFNREINTIGSKSGQLEVSQLVLKAKSWLEKIREQVQNLE
ncbi:MAG: YicC/YloC family endoribonuclease [bacterium]|nr:YicC/YloC family endoribonuclease [bacterium]